MPGGDAAQRGVAALASSETRALGDAEFAARGSRRRCRRHAGLRGAQARDYAEGPRHLLTAVAGDPDNLQDVYQLSVAELEARR